MLVLPEECCGGFSAVAVHRWSSTSFSFRSGNSSWFRLFSRPQSFPSCCSMVDVPFMRACRVSGAAVEKTLTLPQLQLGLFLRPFVRCSPVEYRIMDFSGRILPDVPYSALLGSTVDTCPRQSTSSCFLLVVMHLALCSLACRPFVADNSGCARLVLLLTMQIALFSPFPSSGPRCATSWPVWTRRTENSCVAPQHAPCIWQSLVRCWSCLRCTGLWTVLGDNSRNGFRILHSLVRQWTQVHAPEYGGWFCW